ncbi:MAG: hypothetical protein JSV14_02020 [Deltaproteobacteria bacterium]|nr:MAG: hypothetical protein JSV14_02020 [Deltaproteobacteria bacterium]
MTDNSGTEGDRRQEKDRRSTTDRRSREDRRSSTDRRSNEDRREGWGKIEDQRLLSAVFVVMDEIKALLETEEESSVISPEVKPAGSEAVMTVESKVGVRGETTVTVDREHYEELLTRLGQLEVEKENLLVYKNNMLEIKGALSHKEKEFQQAKAKLHMMEKELRRLKKMGWWKRMSGRKWRMTGG